MLGGPIEGIGNFPCFNGHMDGILGGGATVAFAWNSRLQWCCRWAENKADDIGWALQCLAVPGRWELEKGRQGFQI